MYDTLSRGGVLLTVVELVSNYGTLRVQLGEAPLEVVSQFEFLQIDVSKSTRRLLSYVNDLRTQLQPSVK